MAIRLTHSGRQKAALGNLALGGDLIEREIPEDDELLMDMVGRSLKFLIWSLPDDCDLFGATDQTTGHALALEQACTFPLDYIQMNQ